MDRVRESLFSILHSKIGDFSGKVIIDAFSGSGALGIESLSRGARACYFAEISTAARDVLNHNLSKIALNLSEKPDIYVHSHFHNIPRIKDLADVVFIDPPYGARLEYQALAHFHTHGMLSVKSITVIETHTHQIPSSIPNFSLIDSRTYGLCALTFWQLS